MGRKVRIVVADAVRDDDLRFVAGCIKGEDLACGAASLARHFKIAAMPASRGGEESLGRRGLAVIGSLNPVTAGQLKRAGRGRGVEVRRVGPADLRRAPRPAHPGTRWLVMALDPRKMRLATTSSSAAKEGEIIARRLARHAVAMMSMWKPESLLFSGGLTAAAVCEELKVQELALVRELSPGLVLSRAFSKSGGRFWMVTKPGGFGTAACLARLMR